MTWSALEWLFCWKITKLVQRLDAFSPEPCDSCPRPRFWYTWFAPVCSSCCLNETFFEQKYFYFDLSHLLLAVTWLRVWMMLIFRQWIGLYTKLYFSFSWKHWSEKSLFKRLHLQKWKKKFNIIKIFALNWYGHRALRFVFWKTVKRGQFHKFCENFVKKSLWKRRGHCGYKPGVFDDLNFPIFLS